MHREKVTAEARVIEAPLAKHQPEAFPLIEVLGLDDTNLPRARVEGACDAALEDEIAALEALVVELCAEVALHFRRDAMRVGIFYLPKRGFAIVGHGQVWEASGVAIFVADRNRGGQLDLELPHQVAAYGGLGHTSPQCVPVLTVQLIGTESGRLCVLRMSRTWSRLASSGQSPSTESWTVKRITNPVSFRAAWSSTSFIFMRSAAVPWMIRFNARNPSSGFSRARRPRAVVT